MQTHAHIAGITAVLCILTAQPATIRASETHCWSFDDQSIHDECANVHGWTQGTPSPYMAGLCSSGYALVGDGATYADTNEVISVAEGESLSIALWAQLPSASPGYVGGLFGFEWPGSGEIRLLHDAEGRIHASHRTDSNVFDEVITDQAVCDGAWHHLAWVRDGVAGELRLYVDGQIAKDPEPIDVGATNEQHELRFFLGAANYQDSAVRYYAGLLDHMHVFDHALTADEITALMADHPGLPGDIDGDGDVDQSDLGILLANYGQTCP